MHVCSYIFILIDFVCLLFSLVVASWSVVAPFVDT
jgi:hypothetical protein